MIVNHFDIDGPFEFIPEVHFDDRGFFSETFNQDKLLHAGMTEQTWVQDNVSFSKSCFTLRGMHFQLTPRAQAKIVRVTSGRIFDVIVDLRSGSIHFGKWLSVTLSAKKGNQLYVPTGFAHGFLTIEPDCIVSYKVSAPFSKMHERSLNWSDEDLAISWPLPESQKPVLSDKDAYAPRLSGLRKELGV